MKTCHAAVQTATYCDKPRTIAAALYNHRKEANLPAKDGVTSQVESLAHKSCDKRSTMPCKGNGEHIVLTIIDRATSTYS